MDHQRVPGAPVRGRKRHPLLKAAPMPKRSPAPTKSTDDFAAWVAKTVPDQVQVYIWVSRSYYRDQGHQINNFQMNIELSHNGHSIEQKSHSLANLARWLIEVAIPVLFPPPKRPLRKLTSESRKLEYRPIEPLFD